MVMSMIGNTNKKAVSEVVRTCRSAFGAVFTVSAVLNILMLTGPLFMLQVYDRVLASNSVPTLVVLGGIALALYMFSGLLEVLRLRALNRISMRVYTKLSGPAFRANIQMPMLLGQKAAGVQPSRDIDAIRRFLGSPGPAAIFDLPFMPFYFLIIFLFHAWLGILALAGGAVIFALVLGNELLSRTPTRELVGHTAAQGKVMTTTRRNAEVLTAMGMFSRFSDRYGDKLKDYYVAQQAMTDRSNFFSTIIKTLRLVLQSGMLGLGAYLVILHEVTPGVMIASSIIMARALSPIEQAVSHWPSFVAARQAASRLNETLRNCREDAGTVGLPAPRQELRVEQMATSVPGEPVVLLQGVEFNLQAGDGLGVIGPSGSGKTSLARALVGIWPILKGSVRLDGSTLDQWVDSERGNFVGYLPQDVELFDGTVAENICRFQPNPDLVDIIKASKLASIHQMVAGLPDGYNTVVGDSGARLSAGQRQRVGLARALYGDPFLVVLDEPNSNLDTEGEKALTAAMHQMREKGSIVIVIAHRTSALAAVNKVLLIQNGQQRQFGLRDDVLGKIAVLSESANPTKEYARAV